MYHTSQGNFTQISTRVDYLCTRCWKRFFLILPGKILEPDHGECPFCEGIAQVYCRYWNSYIHPDKYDQDLNSKSPAVLRKFQLGNTDPNQG